MNQAVVGVGGGSGESREASATAAVRALANKPDAEFGLAVNALLKLLDGRDDACAQISTVLKDLPTDKARIKFCSRALIRADDTAVHNIAGRWLFEHGADNKLRRLQEFAPDRVNRSLQKVAEGVELEFDIYTGSERALRVLLLGRLKNLGIPVSSIDEGYCASRLLCVKQGIEAAIEHAEKRTHAYFDVLSHAVVGVLLHHGTRDDIKTLRRVLAAPPGETEIRQGIVTELIAYAGVILQGQLEGFELVKGVGAERNAYQAAAKQLNEIKKSRVGFQPQLAKPKAPSPLEQLTVLATCSLTDLPRHIEKIGQLSSQLGDAANDQLRQLILRVAAAPDGSKLLTHVLKQMREQSSIARVTMLVELAPINEATRVVVRDDLLALCTRNTTVMPVPPAVRAAALDAFWKLGDYSPLFEGPQQNDLVLLFRPEGAVRSGLFRSREEIKTFVQNVVLPYHDRIAAFGVLAAFRWHRLLSVPTFRNEFTQVEPEFAALIQRCSLEEIDQISLADANNFYILIEVIRLYSIGSERADRLLTRICSSIPERDDVSETLAVAALKMVGQQQMQIAEALLNSGHFKWAAVLTVGALDFVEQSREQKLQDVGKGLVKTSDAVREILDLCGTAVGLTPFEQAGYSILDRLPLSNLRAIYLFVNGRLQGNSANKRTLGERHPWIKPMQYLWDRMNRRES